MSIPPTASTQPGSRRGPATHLPAATVLAGSMGSVATAVRFVEEHACPAHLPTGPGRAVMLTHELVGQAVRRRRGTPVRLALECDAAGLVLAVEIPGIAVAAFGPRARGRAGLELIATIADEWGAEARGKGVRLWARLAPVSPPGPRPG